VYLQKQSLKSGNWEKHRRWFQFDDKEEQGKSAASPVRIEAVPPASSGPVIVDVSPWNEV
jgi:hypothetical protein